MFEYDPYMPEVTTDPNSVYKRLRAECPVYYIERFNAWALARFEDIWEASNDVEHYSASNGTSDRAFLEGQRTELETLASTDPPQHLELRKRVFPYFAPRAARALEASMREWTRECLDKHAPQGRIDGVRDLGAIIAVRVACTINGFPLEDADYLIDVVRRFFRREPGVEGMSESGRAALEEMWDYLSKLIARRKAAPRVGDPVDVLLNDTGPIVGPLSEERVAKHMFLMLVGATETFPKVFATGLLRLWQHPDQRRELVEDASLIPTALTEILRYDMPTQWLGRTVCKDHEVHGHPFRVGQPVLFLYPSGNRDELEFDQPDVFDIHRGAPRILTFGHGEHRCLGSFMARMEGKVLLEETLGRFPEYEVLEDDVVAEPTEFVQGYSEFPITLPS